MRSVSNSTLVIYGGIPEDSSTLNTGTGTFPGTSGQCLNLRKKAGTKTGHCPGQTA